MNVEVDAAPVRPFFSPKALAQFLAVSERTVWAWIADGTIPSYKIGESRRIAAADVDAFLEARREANQPGG